MCGRYVRFTPLRQLLPQFGVRPERIDDKLPGGYNIAPGQNILVVREDTEQGRTYGLLRWGLIPSWAKDPAIGHRMINARAEGVADKPAFRAAFRSRRCLVPADGFYEWAKKGNQRQPYYFQRRDRGSLAFAGLWERWHGNGGVVESCTIITTSANATLRSIHERMPVILAPEDYDLWLAPTQPPALLEQLLRPAPDDLLEAYPVSSQVNRPTGQGPGLIAPEEAPPELPF